MHLHVVVDVARWLPEVGFRHACKLEILLCSCAVCASGFGTYSFLNACVNHLSVLLGIAVLDQMLASRMVAVVHRQHRTEMAMGTNTKA